MSLSSQSAREYKKNIHSFMKGQHWSSILDLRAAKMFPPTGSCFYVGMFLTVMFNVLRKARSNPILFPLLESIVPPD